jgi:hypothetical protein
MPNEKVAQINVAYHPLAMRYTASRLIGEPTTSLPRSEEA